VLFVFKIEGICPRELSLVGMDNACLAFEHQPPQKKIKIEGIFEKIKVSSKELKGLFSLYILAKRRVLTCSSFRSFYCNNV